MASRCLVFDTAQVHLQKNRAFDLDYVKRFPGASLIARLYQEVTDRKWQMLTADVFLQERPPACQAICISEMVSPYTGPLRQCGVIPGIMISAESPNVAWDFYHRLKRYSQGYHHAFLFGGLRDKVNPPTIFHAFYWPNERRTVSFGPRWPDREFLVMVIGNKQRIRVSQQKPFYNARLLLKKMQWTYLQATDSTFRFQDLYEKRLEALLFFSNDPGFRMFGSGWEEPSGLPARYFQAARRAGGTPVVDKIKTLSGFKFALCFENCAFPGYITEKIFDCLFAGCIPVYCGAPDIEAFIPSDVYIDLRNFSDFPDLKQYLSKLSLTEASRYLNSARDFLASKEFVKFHQDALIEQFIDILECEFRAFA